MLAGRQVNHLAIALGEGAVRHVPNKRLHEAVLTPLRRLRIGVQGEQLATNQRVETRL
jgi:hypothetical protein